jgi:hypothetical protein
MRQTVATGIKSAPLTPAKHTATTEPVEIAQSDRPYFEVWLRRTGRQLAISGRLTQVAWALAAEEGGSVEEWRTQLRTLLDGGSLPSLELLTRIDKLLAGSPKPKYNSTQQALLF